jgi:hypothetical protein
MTKMTMTIVQRIQDTMSGQMTLKNELMRQQTGSVSRFASSVTRSMTFCITTRRAANGIKVNYIHHPY